MSTDPRFGLGSTVLLGDAAHCLLGSHALSAEQLVPQKNTEASCKSRPCKVKFTEFKRVPNAARRCRLHQFARFGVVLGLVGPLVPS